MPRDQHVNAYVEGNLSRRKFIRGLVGMGVGLAAAVTFADVLAAKGAGAVCGDDDLCCLPPTTTPNPESSGEPAMSTSAPSGAPGTSFDVTGEGFAPDSEATIDLYSDPIRLKTARIGPSDRFS